MDYTDLLGDKYARRNTTASVPKETPGERLGDVEGSEVVPERKVSNTASRRSTGKSGQGTGAKGKP